MLSLREHPNILLSLYRISQVATTSQSPRAAYAAIIEEIQRLFAPDTATICLINPNNSLLEIEYALGYPSNTDQLAIHLGKGLTGRVAFNGEPIISNDVNNDPRYVKLIENIGSQISAPMTTSEGHIVGVLSVSKRRSWGFTDFDLETLAQIANESSLVLQSVWRKRQLNSQSEQLSALIKVGQNVVSNFETHLLWESVAEAALELTEARSCSLQLYDPAEASVRAVTIRPHTAASGEADATMPLSECLSGAAIRTKKQVEFTDVTTPDYRALEDVPADSSVASCLSTPMIYEGKVIGTLNVFTSQRHLFPNSQRRLLQAFADMAAVAAQNAELYTRVFNSEDRLRKSERLTTLGLLSAEIAHEIRNPLTVLKLLFSSLNLDYHASDPRHKDKKVIGEKLDQLEEIVSKVLSFGKAPSGIFTLWRVDQLIEDTCLLVRHKMRQQKIKLEHRCCKSPPKIHGNKGQLQQVLLNLMINAADAMPDGGRLVIRTAREEAGERKLACIYVEDTGKGIPADLVERIFDSFLTGKSQGTGLGLSIVKRILKSHHGDISVEKTGKSGTTLKVELPAV